MPAIISVSAARRLARATAILLALAVGCYSHAPAANAQPAADPMAGAQLIKTAEPDANGFLVLPLPKPGVGPDGKPETQGQFQAKILRAKNDMLKSLRSELPLDATEQLRIENFFNGFEFRVLTQTSPEDLELLPKRRFDLFKLYILQTKHATNHQQLIDLTLAMMQQIVMNNFHPLVRYNAMLIIGELNEQEVQRVGASPQLPEPYSAALTFMIDRIEDARTPDPIRVAALVGVLRHLEWEPYRGEGKAIPAATRTSLVNSLLKLAEMKTVPAGRSAAGHLWMRRRAVEGLGLAGVKVAQPNVVTAVEAIVKDNAEPLTIRCNAALALGRMNVPAGQKLDATELSRTLGAIAVSAVKGEFDRLEAMDRTEEEHRAVLDALATGGGEGSLGGGFQQQGIGGEGIGAGNFAPEDPKAYRLDVVRKRLRYQLYCVQTGLGFPLDKPGTPPAEVPARKGAHRVAATPAEKKAAEEVLASVNKLANLIEKNKIDLIQLKTDLKVESRSLDAVVAKLAPAAAAPPPAAPVDPLNPAAAAAAPAAPAKPAVANPDDELLGGAPPAKK